MKCSQAPPGDRHGICRRELRCAGLSSWNTPGRNAAGATGQCYPNLLGRIIGELKTRSASREGDEGQAAIVQAWLHIESLALVCWLCKDFSMPPTHRRRMSSNRFHNIAHVHETSTEPSKHACPFRQQHLRFTYPEELCPRRQRYGLGLLELLNIGPPAAYLADVVERIPTDSN